MPTDPKFDREQAERVRDEAHRLDWNQEDRLRRQLTAALAHIASLEKPVVPEAVEKRAADLVERTVDYDGTLMVDGAEPRREPDCGTLRETATMLRSLAAERQTWGKNIEALTDLLADSDVREAELKAELAALKAMPEDGKVREFTNELGNRIKITIEGPTSVSENILTPMEYAQLQAMFSTAPIAPTDGKRAELVKWLRGSRTNDIPVWKLGEWICANGEAIADMLESDARSQSASMASAIGEIKALIKPRLSHWAAEGHGVNMHNAAIGQVLRILAKPGTPDTMPQEVEELAKHWETLANPLSEAMADSARLTLFVQLSKKSAALVRRQETQLSEIVTRAEKFRDWVIGMFPKYGSFINSTFDQHLPTKPGTPAPERDDNQFSGTFSAGLVEGRRSLESILADGKHAIGGITHGLINRELTRLHVLMPDKWFAAQPAADKVADDPKGGE